MFEIQISNPVILKTKNKSSSTIEEAIETIFPLDTEYAFIKWGYIFIPLSYKYDISLMVNDLIKVYTFIKDENVHSYEMHWASNTFASLWHLTKEFGKVKIIAKWTTVLGELEDLLNANNEIIVEPIELTSSVEKMIRFLKKSLFFAGYSASDLTDFDLFDIVLK